MKKFKLKFVKLAAVFIVAAGILNLSGFIHAASLSVTASASTIMSVTVLPLRLAHPAVREI